MEEMTTSMIEPTEEERVSDENDTALLPTPNDSDSDSSTWSLSTSAKTRIFIGFWMLGLCNNFGYVVMLSAAYDILESNEDKHVDGCKQNATILSPHHLICNEAGTGVILLADILPTILIKVSAPFFMHKISYNIRVVFCLLFSLASFVLVGIGTNQYQWLSIIGVVCASFSSGFGEIVFLSFTSHFSRHSVTSWSSGTGAAGIFGSVAYTGLLQVGLSARNTLFVMIIVPVVEAICFYFLIVKPPSVQGWHLCAPSSIEYQQINSSQNSNATHNLTFQQRLALIQPLLKYMVPLMLVYVGEYFINQALFELAYFPTACSFITIGAQYRWYQSLYQIGVFISRSSGSCFTFKHLWILPILQFTNLVLLLTQVLYHYMPEDHGIWIVFAIILWEGLLGGTGYVQAFSRITKEIPEEHREYSMGVASVADTSGIVISAFTSIAAHNGLCGKDITWS